MNIVFDKVTKTYAQKTVFSDFSYTFALEGITALMGASGCGKTTLLRLMCGLETPDSGTVFGKPNPVTFLFQENRLLPWATALENVETVCDRQTAKRVLQQVGLGAELRSLPAALSGGMQRRVAFARALAHQSPLLLLDEPFKGLDSALKKDLIALLCEEAKKRPILFVTHNHEEAEFAGAKVLDFEGLKKIM